MLTNKKKAIAVFAILFCLLNYAVAVWWSSEPELIAIQEFSAQQSEQENVMTAAGYATSTALIEIVDTLLNKSGGYLSNDIMPPSLLMDNMPAWEFGVLEVARDTALSMRRDLARSQSQSVEDPDLVKAQPLLNISHTSWTMPSAEDQYQDAIKALKSYRSRLNEFDKPSQFFARADNLREWLQFVEKRLGAQSQSLSASVGRESLNSFGILDGQTEQNIKTSWWQIDDNFYQARGTCWALLVMFKALEIDFEDVLQNKNAYVSFQQIIRELEATQVSFWSPIILNGSGFGFVANHSLVMANYISRANAAVINLRELLDQG